MDGEKINAVISRSITALFVAGVLVAVPMALVQEIIGREAMLAYLPRWSVFLPAALVAPALLWCLALTVGHCCMRAELLPINDPRRPSRLAWHQYYVPLYCLCGNVADPNKHWLFEYCGLKGLHCMGCASVDCASCLAKGERARAALAASVTACAAARAAADGAVGGALADGATADSAANSATADSAADGAAADSAANSATADSAAGGAVNKKEQ